LTSAPPPRPAVRPPAGHGRGARRTPVRERTPPPRPIRHRLWPPRLTRRHRGAAIGHAASRNRRHFTAPNRRGARRPLPFVLDHSNLHRVPHRHGRSPVPLNVGDVGPAQGRLRGPRPRRSRADGVVGARRGGRAIAGRSLPTAAGGARGAGAEVLRPSWSSANVLTGPSMRVVRLTGRCPTAAADRASALT
jgi:hypothetical protein